MEKIKLIIADEDPNYLELFANYIRSSEYNNKCFIKSFSQLVSLEQYVQEHSVDILLISPSMLSRLKEWNKCICINLLLEQKQETANYETLDKEYPVVQKYQSLHKLMAQVLSGYTSRNKSGIIPSKGDRKTEVWSIYSSTGACGKTTLAVNMAKQLGIQQWKVFYLNLEMLSSLLAILPDSADKNNEFSEMLYYLKSDKKQLAAKIEIIRNRNAVCKFDYFLPLTNIKEILEISREDSASLIRFLVSLSIYDLIIIDLDASIHERNLGAMDQSDRIVWVLLDEQQSLYKTNQLLEEWKENHKEMFQQFMDKTFYVVNKYTGSLSNYFKTYPDFNIIGCLPYIPEWKYVQHNDQIYTSVPFNEQLLKLGSAMLTSIGGGYH
ncbi:MAG TPA: AAA family ATPase [Bacilli bacterium]